MKISITIIISTLLITFISCSKKEIPSQKQQENTSVKKESVDSNKKQTEVKYDTVKELKKLVLDKSLSCEVKKNKITVKSKDGKAKFKIEIPEISGLENKEIQTKINALLKSEFTSNIEGFGENMSITNENDIAKFAQELKEINGTYDCDITSEVTMTKNGILSIRLNYLGVQVPAAHPTHDFKGININLSTGEKFGISNIFKVKTEYLKVIEKFLKKDGQDLPDKNDPKFDFCITPKSIIIFNILSGAAASYELEIKFSDIKDELTEDISNWN